MLFFTAFASATVYSLPDLLVSTADALQELTKVVEAGKGLGPEQVPAEALAQLDDLSAQAAALADQASKLQGYQRQFGVQQSDIRVAPEVSQ